MTNSKDIIVKLRLLVKPPININNFFYKMTYTKFGYQNEDGSYVSPRTIKHALTKFTANPSANKNGLVAIDSEEIVLFKYTNNIKKTSFPAAKNGSAWFQIENRSNGKVVRKNKYPQWSYRHKREISEYKWDTTSSKNSTTPNTKKEQQIKQKCPHTVDGAIEVAKYIVDEIKKNSKSRTVSSIKHLLERSKNLQWFDAIGGANPAMLYSDALVLWTLKVGPTMDWDHKPKIAEHPVLKKTTTRRRLRAEEQGGKESTKYFHKYKGYDYFYDVWSNIHYGYVGMVAGFTWYGRRLYRKRTDRRFK
ncbi:polymorphic toxin type 44 domain-containing protein [Psychrobacter sp. ENNN9_III]|uniref:polymorphic toxin type 44 domain-containing protein n=1 Tax=Psychrobacter sp. ENNN9_III TaxID=1254334 RepID=UPI00071E7883